MSEYKTLTEFAASLHHQPTRYEAALIDEIERLRGLLRFIRDAVWTESKESIAGRIDDVLGATVQPPAAPGCQHDLCKPDTTIETMTNYDARCTVCKLEWHMMGLAAAVTSTPGRATDDGEDVRK